MLLTKWNVVPILNMIMIIIITYIEKGKYIDVRSTPQDCHPYVGGAPLIIRCFGLREAGEHTCIHLY